VEAYHLYLQGVHHRYTTYNLVAALRSFERAVELDAGYADAYVGIAYTATTLSNFSLLSPRDARTKGRAAIARALELDARSAGAHATLGWWKLLHEWDWAGSEQSLQQSLTLDPSNLEGQAYSGMLCAVLDRAEAALAHANRLIEIDPLSSWSHGIAAFIHFTVGRGRNAEALSRRGIEVGPTSALPRWVSGMSLRMLGRYEEAAARFEEALPLTGGAAYLLCELGGTLALAGATERAEALFAKVDEQSRTGYVSPAWRAVITLGLGRIDQTFALIEAAYQEGNPMLPFLGSPWWDALRGDPRLIDLKRRIGLPTSVTEPRRDPDRADAG
jgi:tetratricopeptide (TPR) repeat protein